MTRGGFRLDIGDMERRRVELRLHLERERRRFQQADQMDTFEKLLYDSLPQANINEQNNIIQLERLDGDSAARKLESFLIRVIMASSHTEHQEAIQRVLRACLKSSRQQTVSLAKEMTVLEPMCYFCGDVSPAQPVANATIGYGESLHQHLAGLLASGNGRIVDEPVNMIVKGSTSSAEHNEMDVDGDDDDVSVDVPLYIDCDEPPEPRTPQSNGHTAPPAQPLNLNINSNTRQSGASGNHAPPLTPPLTSAEPTPDAQTAKRTFDYDAANQRPATSTPIACRVARTHANTRRPTNGNGNNATAAAATTNQSMESLSAHYRTQTLASAEKLRQQKQRESQLSQSQPTQQNTATTNASTILSQPTSNAQQQSLEPLAGPSGLQAPQTHTISFGISQQQQQQTENDNENGLQDDLRGMLERTNDEPLSAATYLSARAAASSDEDGSSSPSRLSQRFKKTPKRGRGRANTSVSFERRTSTPQRNAAPNSNNDTKSVLRESKRNVARRGR